MSPYALLSQVCHAVRNGLAKGKEIKEIKLFLKKTGLLEDYKELDDISSADFPFTLVEYLAGLSSLNQEGERIALLEEAQRHFYSFIQRCEELTDLETQQKKLPPGERRMQFITSSQETGFLLKKIAAGEALERKLWNDSLKWLYFNTFHQLARIEQEMLHAKRYNAQTTKKLPEKKTLSGTEYLKQLKTLAIKDEEKRPLSEEEKLQRERQFDDFKDENKRGSGNSRRKM